MFVRLNIIITFAILIIHIALFNKFIYASEFKVFLPLRYELLVLNEAGFFIDIMRKVRKCKICREEFSTTVSKNEKVCYKRKCRKAYSEIKRRKKRELEVGVEMICKNCGKKFPKRKRKLYKDKYCSKKCFKEAIKKAKKKQKSIYLLNKRKTYFNIFERDGFRCMYCGKTPKDDKVKLVIDHIMPIVKGGKSEPQNMITSCSKCNNHKYNRLLPKQLIIEFWDYCDNNNINYSNKFKEYWEKEHKRRVGILKKKNICQN